MGYEWIELAVAALVVFSALGAGFVTFKKDKIGSPQLEPQKATQFQVAESVDPEKFVTLEEALQKTRQGFWGRIKGVFDNKSSVGTAELEQIEEILYTSDLGPKTVQMLIHQIQSQFRPDMNSMHLHELLKSEMLSIFQNNKSNLQALEGMRIHSPEVWMVVGVNGVGKTTTIGKLCHKLASQNLKVMVAAGDTFRAAAKEQLKTWADRSQVLFFSPEGVENPSGVAFDAVKSAVLEKVDVLIVDTAGRLHTQSHLMEELKKVKRVMDKALPGCPHEVLLVLDANSGQNALIQAQQFDEALGVTGVILTKMDGTAKGGVALGVASDLNLNIKLIGVGEKVTDLRPFNAKEFVESIL
jgi:fused signal recognition particle receptor